MSIADDPISKVEAAVRHDKPTAQGGGWFRAFWRWHFYASFLVIPLLLMLAMTGLIYLFRFQLEPMLHADVMKVPAPVSATAIAQPYAVQQQSVEEAYPDATIVSMTEPSADDRSTSFSIEAGDGAARDVYVNPWNAEVLGSLDPDSTLSGTAIRIHGDLMVGPGGDYAIEIAACWAIVMALTGYLIFFKGRAARKRSRMRGIATRRRHAWIGAVVGAGLLLLLVTGLPWTGWWGDRVQKLATDRETSLWGEDPGALSNPTSTLDESLPHSHKVQVPWGLGKDEVPTSDPTGQEVSVANLDTAIAVGVANGLRHPITVALPADDKGVFSAIGYAFHDPGRERTVHVDQYGGTVVSAYGYSDYPVLAKVVSQGIALHEGRRFGLVSFWGTFAFCLGVLFLCVTGPLMWWKRRPRGVSAPGAPRGRLPIRTTWWLAVGLAALGLLLPLFGLSLVVVLLLDQVLLRRVPRLRTWFAVTD